MKVTAPSLLERMSLPSKPYSPKHSLTRQRMDKGEGSSRKERAEVVEPEIRPTESNRTLPMATSHKSDFRPEESPEPAGWTNADEDAALHC